LVIGRGLWVLGAVLGWLVGLPALRIRGAQLAVVTLTGAIAIERFVFRNPRLVGQTGELINDPKLFGLNLAVRAGTDPGERQDLRRRSLQIDEEVIERVGAGW